MHPGSDSYDVAVIGGGNAGLCAALTAREAGALRLKMIATCRGPSVDGKPAAGCACASATARKRMGKYRGIKRMTG